MEKSYKYIAVIKQLENGKFLIKFPDFERITGLAEKEEGIEKVATGILKTKLQELKDENIEIPTAKEIVEIQKTLQEGEFTTYITINNLIKFNINKENVKETFDNLRNKSEEMLKGDFKENVEKIYNKSEEFVKNKIGTNVKSENYHFIGVVGGILYILGAFMPFVGANIPFFGKIRFGVTTLGRLKDFQGFVDISQQTFTIRFIVILFIMSGAFTAYSAYRKHKFYFKSGILISAVLYVMAFLYLFIQIMSIDKEARPYIGFSFAWIVLLLGLISMGVSFILQNKNPDESEEISQEE
ncbi:MAG: hypothetical protein MR673_02950 [Fusobacterium perfoetens]|uniref:type II toxin-antitoxin system HicB family antitoxin n=1 Tax=Fusobacterium perfoetens TaxID=852 RepID=UPI0023F05EEF|nr:hypothetical protein [Fusobacterium perfoetens]MCI6152068.1 hypothetical protein [Fusobacterium perfoetens]MDY3238041.1 hypothetical protein [Fusobacterium perfoetens]